MITGPVDLWQSRTGIADALLVLSPHLTRSLVMGFIKIIVPDGINDSSADCREIMRNAAIEAIKKVAAFALFLVENFFPRYHF